MTSIDMLNRAVDCIKGKYQSNHEPDVQGAMEALLKYCIATEIDRRMVFYKEVTYRIDLAQKSGSVESAASLMVIRDEEAESLSVLDILLKELS